jgi:hypothetical protein
MKLIRGWLLPRKHKDKISAAEQIEALKTTHYVLPGCCMKDRIHLLQPGPAADYKLACGCIDCKPELWCQGSTERGERCPEPAWYPDKEGPRKWCRAHYQEVVRGGWRAGGSGQKGVEPPAFLRGLLAGAGKVGR